MSTGSKTTQSPYDVSMMQVDSFAFAVVPQLYVVTAKIPDFDGYLVFFDWTRAIAFILLGRPEP